MEIEEFKLKDGRIVNIKRLTMEDYDADNGYEYVHDWLNKVNKFLNLEFEKEDLETNKTNFRFVMSKEGFIMIGGVYNGKIIASANLELNLNNKKMREIGKWGIAIHPDFQNQGLGTRLLQIIEQHAKEKGVKKLETEYYLGNVSAEKLYVKKLKYQIEGRRRFGGKLKDGTYTDRVLIGKIIDVSMKEK